MMLLAEVAETFGLHALADFFIGLEVNRRMRSPEAREMIRRRVAWQMKQHSTQVEIERRLAAALRAEAK